jgi:hypothetical protein
MIDFVGQKSPSFSAIAAASGAGKHFRRANIAPNRGPMSGRPARIRQREVQLIVRGAMKAGAKILSVHIGEVRVDVSLDEQKPVAPDEQITL